MGSLCVVSSQERRSPHTSATHVGASIFGAAGDTWDDEPSSSPHSLHRRFFRTCPTFLLESRMESKATGQLLLRNFRCVPRRPPFVDIRIRRDFALARSETDW